MNRRIALSKILQSVKFFDQLVVELNFIFKTWWGNNDDGVVSCAVTSTQGWSEALIATLDYFSLNDIAEWYKLLEPGESDDFDFTVAELLMSTCFDYEGNLINNECSVKTYGKMWCNFQFRAPTYIDGHTEPYKFDLVKWCTHEPMEVYSIDKSKNITTTKGCYSVGMLEWDPKDEYFEFRSCGMRYFEAHVPGLEKFIKDFAEEMRVKLSTPTLS